MGPPRNLIVLLPMRGIVWSCRCKFGSKRLAVDDWIPREKYLGCPEKPLFHTGQKVLTASRAICNQTGVICI